MNLPESGNLQDPSIGGSNPPEASTFSFRSLEDSVMTSPPPQKPQVSPSAFDTKTTLHDVGQWNLLKAILPYTTPVPGGPLSTMDDLMHLPDIEDATGRKLFFKIDTFVQSTDMPPRMSFDNAGRKAVTAVVSDFGVKGVQPMGVGVSLCLPRNMLANDAIKIVQGVAGACKHYGCGYYGGDLNEGKEIVITPVAVGFGDTKKVASRGGAHTGDILCVSDFLGRTAAGLEILLQGKVCPQSARIKLETAVYAPETPLEQGIALAEHNLATAAIDSSDGVAFSIAQLATESNCGFEVIAGSLPIAPEVAEYVAVPVKQIDLALYGGEEYCYLWTIPKNKLADAHALCTEHGWHLFEIGKVTQGSTIVLKSEGGKKSPLRTHGFTHFTNESPLS